MMQFMTGQMVEQRADADRIAIRHTFSQQILFRKAAE
jgi:hypothetical protein